VRPYRVTGKRLADIVGSSLSVLCLAPVFLLCALAIWLEDRGPAIFRQRRIGKGGREFVLFKFRSMPIGTRHVPSANAAALRTTRVGRLLRRTNIDELPQLLNVLKGDMSLVGPRPALPSQEDVIELRRENGSLLLRPGLTGLAQVKSYDGMPACEKVEWDGRYAEGISFLNDLKIVLGTFRYLLKPPPVY
jgi:O-antigen biosynthesis protein WbqP